MIIHLTGMPGVGKLTIARELSADLQARLIDNHLAIDLARSIADRGGAYIAVLERILGAFHQALLDYPPSEPLVFTNALAQGVPEDEARAEAVRRLAAQLGRPYIPVLVACDPAENARRLESPERADKGKLLDRAELEKLIANYQIAHPADHPHALTVDVTQLSPRQAAQQIAAHARTARTIEPSEP